MTKLQETIAKKRAASLEAHEVKRKLIALFRTYGFASDEIASSENALHSVNIFTIPAESLADIPKEASFVIKAYHGNISVFVNKYKTQAEQEIHFFYDQDSARAIFENIIEIFENFLDFIEFK